MAILWARVMAYYAYDSVAIEKEPAMPRNASSVSPRHNFHVPLPHDVYTELRAEAARRNTPANAVAREAIRHWLAMRREAEIDGAVLAYATAAAGTADDLNPDLEQAGLESVGETA